MFEYLTHYYAKGSVPFRSLSALTDSEALKIMESLYEKIALKEYAIYQQLCMPKHGNPLYQQRQSFQISDKNVFSVNGPEWNDDAIRIAWFSMTNTIRYGLIAVRNFVTFQLESNPFTFNEAIEDVSKVYIELNHKAISRWGNENPYPKYFKI